MSDNNQQESSTANDRQRSAFYRMSRKVLLAGIGAVVLAQDEADRFVNHLVEKGELAEKDARRLIRELADKREKLEREKRARPAAAATRADIEALTARINELNKKLEELKQSQSSSSTPQ